MRYLLILLLVGCTASEGRMDVNESSELICAGFCKVVITDSAQKEKHEASVDKVVARQPGEDDESE
jgi:hypothetical protein